MDRVVSAALRVDFDVSTPRAARDFATAAMGGCREPGRRARRCVGMAAESTRHIRGAGDRAREWRGVRARPNVASNGSVELADILSRAGVRLKPDSGARIVRVALRVPRPRRSAPGRADRARSGGRDGSCERDLPRGKSERIDEGGYRGIVVPAPRGELVVLGQDGDAGIRRRHCTGRAGLRSVVTISSSTSSSRPWPHRTPPWSAKRSPRPCRSSDRRTHSWPWRTRDLPLQAFAPSHLTLASSAALTGVAAMLPNNSAAAVAIMAALVGFFIRLTP